PHRAALEHTTLLRCRAGTRLEPGRGRASDECDARLLRCRRRCTDDRVTPSGASVLRFGHRPSGRKSSRSSFLLEWARTSPTVEKEMECHQMTGSVKKVVPERGFGFIAADDGAEY